MTLSASIQTLRVPAGKAAPSSGRQRSLASSPLRELAAALRETSSTHERITLLENAHSAHGALNLADCDLRWMDWSTLIAAGITPTLFDGADLRRATLSGAALARIFLRFARLDGALIVGANLAGADLSASSLRGAHLTGANLSRADLSYADLRGASLLTTDMADMTATGADMRDTLLHSATMARAVLRGADLRWSRLDGANLLRSDLREARFAGATLAMTNLSGARLSSTTDFSYAFLHRVRLEHIGISSRNIRGGLAEDLSDFRRSRDTYLALMRHFEAEGQADDARWAHVRACRMNTLSHRPDRARRYYPADWVASPMPALPAHPLGAIVLSPWHAAKVRLRSPLATTGHGILWLAGILSCASTDYGTSFRRILLSLACIWLAFGLFYQLAGSVGHVDNQAGARWYDGLHYSAAAITPIDAYPLMATSHIAHAAAITEGILGMMLIGAMGFVISARLQGRKGSRR